jgi:hypothetical protein
MYDSTILRYVFFLSCAASLAGCTALLSLGDKQCNQSADCVSAQLGDSCVDHVCINGKPYAGDSGGPGGACSTDKQCAGTSTPRCFHSACATMETYQRWTCSAVPDATQSTVKYGFKVVDFLSKKAPGKVVVKACRNSDAACVEPVSSWTDTAGTGDATLILPAGFFGYFEITSDEVPALLAVTQPITQDAENRDVPVLSASTVQLLAQLAGFPYDMTKGLALLEALDCLGMPQGGIQFTASRKADQFYLVDQVPSKEAQLTEFDPTDNTADGGFINLEPGFTTFAAHLGVGGVELGSFNAQIRANTITFIDMHF